MKFGKPKIEVVQLELFTNRFRAIAEEMGEMLRRTAISTNVKERLDFSCAILDAAGELVVNAPHMPVHLGALGLCVRSLLAELEIAPGDVVVTNHPAYGGSHLPDITLVMPVVSAKNKLLGYVANRAHHAEIGGTRPGSMPPFATRLSEEGVVIRPFHLIKADKPDWQRMRNLLTAGPDPTRALSDNLADLRAAVAANTRGALALQRLADTHGHDTVAHAMSDLKRLAERQIRAALQALPDGSYQAEDALDDGSPLNVQIEISGDTAAIDFGGTAAVHPGNLNATPAIVRSVVIYIMRLLIDQPLPLNEGLMQPVSVTIPKGILNPEFPEDPDRAPAVVGGNVETSQRLVNLFLQALGLAAASQGTMNNTLFGTDAFGYYETVCGGCGAGPGFDGASAVHTHMTNTRITDPEILEHRYPVRLERFAIRKGSGGAGRFRGGDGVIRELTFLREMTLSFVSQHRNHGPAGLAGGQPGQPGSQQIVRASGKTSKLKSVDGCRVYPGDRLVLETPGGGGCGG
ncbi:MAG: hydantoinase B/oxoprolinase family protein [bacterium]